MPDRASTYGSARPNLNPIYSSARPIVPHVSGHAQKRSFGLLGTYPPTQCGIATFTRALLQSIAAAAPDDRVGVIRVLDAPAGREGTEVAGHLRSDLSNTHAAAASALNSFDVAIIQHEYGIYGGPDGDQVLAVLDQVRVPVATVAHTVLAHPTQRQESVLRQVIEASDVAVAMTDAARDRLIDRYDVDPARVAVIGHGASIRLEPLRTLPSTDPFSLPAPHSPLILTWGLLGPGKGIEWAIDALSLLRDVSPLPNYVVAGQTHPRVRQQQGDAYRDQLRQRAADAGVEDMLRFEDSYLDDAALTRLIRLADVVLLPYDSPEQVTSGVLVEAIAAGKPVVATAFPHAVELCATGAGIVVAHGDSAALGEALHRVLTAPGLAQRMRTEAARIAPSLRWSAVADQYRALTAGLLAVPNTPRG
jgi:glycosyltransferase involved in cell wall biosynthesis